MKWVGSVGCNGQTLQLLSLPSVSCSKIHFVSQQFVMKKKTHISIHELVNVNASHSSD